MTLDQLKRKHRFRFPRHDEVAYVLVAEDSNMEALRSELIPGEFTKPSGGSRKDMGFHLQSLMHEFRGKSMLLAQHALAISYLRRQTPYTSKAWSLFERMWSEEGVFLLSELSTRWLISTLQTFFDHSPNADDRTCGGIGFTYGNLIKIYEAERNAERRKELAAPPRHLQANNVDGLGSFKVGSDILLNLHRTIYDAAAASDLAGPVLEEFMVRVQGSETVFSRLDRLADARPDAHRVHLKKSFGAR